MLLDFSNYSILFDLPFILVSRVTCVFYVSIGCLHAFRNGWWISGCFQNGILLFRFMSLLMVHFINMSLINNWHHHDIFGPENVHSLIASYSVPNLCMMALNDLSSILVSFLKSTFKELWEAVAVGLYSKLEIFYASVAMILEERIIMYLAVWTVPLS